MDNDSIKILVESGLFSEIDLNFAELVCRLAGEQKSWPLFLAALLASYVVNERRQICLPLAGLPDDFSAWLLSGSEVEVAAETVEKLAGLSWPEAWETQLGAHPAVAGPANAAARHHLLVLDDGRLYLQRYWDYEQRLARMINQRLRAVPVAVEDLSLPHSLPRLAPRFSEIDKTGALNYQTAAVCAGLRNRFTIISGGPGCGKTSVVAAIAALWLEIRPQMQIMLCAPTGRAQARLQQALREEAEFLEIGDELKSRLVNLSAATIHRLLGYRPGHGFRCNEKKRLPVDLLIVDEASMVPLSLLTNLFAALPDECRVVLLGDRNQLASVEAGAVLGDLSSTGAGNFFSRTFIDDYNCLLETSALVQGPALEFADENIENPDRSRFQDHIVELEKSYRFAEGCGISRLQRAVIGSDVLSEESLLEILADDDSGEVSVRYLADSGLNLNRTIFAYLNSLKVELNGAEVPFKSYLDDSELASAFAMFESCRLLSPLRRGPFGVNNLNRIMAQVVGGADFGFYSKGYPLMIVQNAPRLKLYNGDTGIMWPDADGRLLAWFRRADGSFASFTPLQLPAYETAFATTVHKAQGAGFQKVVLMWPNSNPTLLTREMLYTGITRAAKKVELWLPERASVASLVAACGRQVKRSSGLLQALRRAV